MEDTKTRAKGIRLEELAAEAKHARDRHRLYKAKTFGPRLTSPGRLRELQRARHLAEARWRRAQSESSAQTTTGAQH